MTEKNEKKLEEMVNGLVEIGPIPRPSQFGRWVRRVQPNLKSLPKVNEYTCYRTKEPLVVDGRLSDSIWDRAPWSNAFGIISSGAKVPYNTQIAMLWDDEYLYTGFRVEDPDIRASMTGFNDHVYIQDEDIELFIQGDGFYYELGVNSLNTTYQIKWTLIENLVGNKDYMKLEELFKTPDFLYFTATEGEKIGRHGNLGYELPGLKHAVWLDGILNTPAIVDKGWQVQFAIPWESMREFCLTNKPLFPPKPGDELRITSYRGHHYRKPDDKSILESWTWGVMGADNIHIPERWNKIQFSEDSV